MSVIVRDGADRMDRRLEFTALVCCELIVAVHRFSCVFAICRLAQRRSQSCNLWAFRIEKDLSLTELCDLFIGHGSSAILLDLVLSGDRLYAAINGAGVVAVDISDPAKLRVHSLFDTSQFAEGIAVRNSIAIVADGSGGTLVVELRPKGYGKLVASYPTADWTYDDDNLGEYIYSCERDGGIEIFTADAFRQ
jgi:hypothetical protein